MAASRNDAATAKRVAARALRAMAYDRQSFKDKVEEHIGGALLEFYKATLAKRLGHTRWVQHWNSEVRTLLDRNLITVLRHEVRGFKDRRRAVAEVVAALKRKNSGYRRSAEAIVMKDYGLAKLKAELVDDDTRAFWARVDAAIEAGLAE